MSKICQTPPVRYAIGVAINVRNFSHLNSRDARVVHDRHKLDLELAISNGVGKDAGDGQILASSGGQDIEIRQHLFALNAYIENTLTNGTPIGLRFVNRCLINTLGTIEL